MDTTLLFCFSAKCSPSVPLLRRQRQADLCEFEVSLVYKVNSRTAKAIKRNPVSKQTKQQQKNRNHSEIQNQDLLGQKFREKKSVYAPMNMVCLTIKMSECECPVNIMKPRKEKMREMGRM